MTDTSDRSIPDQPDVVVTSFGYLHGRPPPADITIDVRRHFRDPHIDPAFRELTGKDQSVRQRVMATTGVLGLVDAVVAVAKALLWTPHAEGQVVKVAIGCAGGRHRSVVIADAVDERLTYDWNTEVEHLHIHEPVVTRETFEPCATCGYPRAVHGQNKPGVCGQFKAGKS